MLSINLKNKFMDRLRDGVYYCNKRDTVNKRNSVKHGFLQLADTAGLAKFYFYKMLFRPDELKGSLVQVTE